MDTLYIFGNGFDLYHGLKTRYADFHQFVSDNYAELETALENYFNFQVDDNYLWKSFESDLCKFNHQSFFDDINHLDVMDESFERSDCFGLEDDIAQQSEDLVNDIREAFLSWIESIEYPERVSPEARQIYFKPSSLFINFNYTDTLKELYQIPQTDILYLHNNANDCSGELIFGHAEKKEKMPKEDELDEEGNSNRTMFTDAEDAARSPFYEFQKNTTDIIKTHVAFFKKLNCIKEVVVLGHSLGKVDWPYFHKIASIIPEANWYFSYFPESAKKTTETEARKMLKGKASGVRMKRIDEYL
jgi:hypothetical protein